jgi:hypothetical protein
LKERLRMWLVWAVGAGLEYESAGADGETGGNAFSWVSDRELLVLSAGGEITVRTDTVFGASQQR